MFTPAIAAVRPSFTDRYRYLFLKLLLYLSFINSKKIVITIKHDKQELIYNATVFIADTILNIIVQKLIQLLFKICYPSLRQRQYLPIIHINFIPLNFYYVP